MARPMKDSGIEWIGEIPSEWKINTAFQTFTQVKNKNTDLRERNLLSLSYGKIKRKNIETTDGLLPESFDGYNIIEANDIVLRLTDLQNDQKSLRVGLSTERGIVTSAYLTLRNRSDSLASYLYYFLHAFDISKGFYGMGAGVRQGLNWDGMKWLKILTPEVSEQQRITEFLDRRMLAIDGVIAETEKTIEEYRKLKQSIISEAVTQSIRTSTEMKESGIEWIGRIPASWKVMPHKYVMHKVKEICEHYSGEDIISLSMFGVRIRDLDAGGKMPTTFDGYQYVEPEDMLLCLFDIDVTPRCVGIVKNHGVTSPAYSRFIVHEGFLNRYYDYLLRFIDDKKVFVHLAKNLRSSLTETDFGAIKTVVPPYDEQKEIADYLDEKCAAIDEIIEKKQQLLTELDAYKKSVIYEYVTGKKEV